MPLLLSMLMWHKPFIMYSRNSVCRLRLKRDGTRWRTVGEVKGKLANGVGSQSPSHRFTLPRNLVYPALLPLMRTPRLPVVDWTDAPADLNGLVLFVERRNLLSARVPSHFKRSLLMGVVDHLDHDPLIRDDFGTDDSQVWSSWTAMGLREKVASVSENWFANCQSGINCGSHVIKHP